MYVGLFVLVQFTCLLYISVWICKRYLQDFLATVSFVACSVLDHVFSLTMFSVQKKKTLTSCIRQKTKRNKTEQTRQHKKQTSKQKNMCSYVTAHVLYDPSKSYTAYEHSRCGLA